MLRVNLAGVTSCDYRLFDMLTPTQKPHRRSAYWYYQASDWTDDLAS